MYRLFSSFRPSISRSLPRTTRIITSPTTARTTHTTMPISAIPHPNSKFETHGNFDLVKRFHLDFADIGVSKWRSRETGLSVVHLDYQAPLVNGYFVVNTEIFNDSGCPHTLEHLVFLGSQKYPYKGIIDNFANRGFANGTNAWTDTDHTAYTVETAGEQGFLQLLPIYVDHILYPTLTQAGFVTEVHHIDGEGEDSGVVYSEMQGRENTVWDLMGLRMQRLVNPSGSAYRSETGGLMEALRVLNIDQIRDYHHTYYVPHNLTLIVTGKLASGTASLLDVLQNQVEPSIVAYGQNKGPKPDGWKRPFVETPSAQRQPFPETIKETVDFPEKDESLGELYMTFLGPPPNAFLELHALEMLALYLTSSSVAPLNKEYIEIEKPWCTAIHFNQSERVTAVDLSVYCFSVPVAHLDTFDTKLQASLTRIVDEGIDMKRMAMVISRGERQLRSELDSSKGEAFYGEVIADALYGAEDGSDLTPSLSKMKQFPELKTWTSEQWSDLLRRYYIDPSYVVVRGRPSAEMADRLVAEEKARTAAQREHLGPAGLEESKRILEDAKKEHEKPIPEEILTAFPVPDVKSIAWIPVQSVHEQHGQKGRSPTVTPHNREVARHVEQDGSPLPFFVQYDHVKSDFVTVTVYFSLAKVPARLRPLVAAYSEMFFSLPVKTSTGEQLTHEEVVNKLQTETVHHEASFSIGTSFPETFWANVVVETARYDTAIQWLKDLIYGSVFDIERLLVKVAQLQQSLPERKRDGSTVLESVHSELFFNETSTWRTNQVLPQIDFIRKVAQQLQDSPEEVVKDFEELRTYLTDPSGVRVSVAGNVLALNEPRNTWAKHFADVLPNTPLAPVRLAADTLSAVGKNPVKKAIVVSLPTIESSFVMHTTKGVQGWTHPDVPALRVASVVLNATESYLWKSIRGSGLAYGANCQLDYESGLLHFQLYRSSNSIEAFKQAASVIKGLTDGSIPFDETVLDAAKSSIVFSVTKTVSTPDHAAMVSFVNQALKGVSQNYTIEQLERYQQITKEDVLAVLRKYFLPLFDSASSTAVVVTAPGKVSQISEELGKIGFQVEQRTLEVEEDEDGSAEDSDESGSESDSGR